VGARDRARWSGHPARGAGREPAGARPATQGDGHPPVGGDAGGDDGGRIRRAGKGRAHLTARSASPVERHEAGQVPRGCASRAPHDDGRDVTGAVPAVTSDARTGGPDPLGGGFALPAGRGVKDGVRAAIPLLSVRDGSARAVVHTATGRFEHEGQRLSLHAGGCISADGTSEAVTVEASPARAASALPDPPASPEDLSKAVAAVVRLLEIGTERSPVAPQVAAALGALPWRAVRGAFPSSIPSSGPTGPRTTSAARLARGGVATGAGSRAGRVSASLGERP
jgi:hypothetical protein